jgi:hypothetical protein
MTVHPGTDLQVVNGNARFADARTAGKYPLPCSTDAVWHIDNDMAVCQLHIDHITAESIVIPSLAIVDVEDYAYQVQLIHDNSRWPLAPVPNPNAEFPASEPRGVAGPVSTHVDCFHIHQPLADVTLEFRLRFSGRLPTRYLVTASWRPLHLEQPNGPLASVCCTPPPALSQMSQGGPAGPAICSPTCLAMALRGFDDAANLLQIAENCFDPVTKIYGVWPNAIRTAARRGFVGATEAFVDWADAERVLEHGYPLIASIRYAAGALPGAPLKATGGHLVLIHGTSPECVVTNDPAAADVATVPRTYDAATFTQAWLSYRGAAYILVP